MTDTYRFLSDEWVAAAREIRAEYHGRIETPEIDVKMNVIVTDAPFGSGDIEGHIDTTGGQLQLDYGHLADADVTLTTDYATAETVFVDQDPQSAMQAFLAGRVVVDGDMAKLMLLFGQRAQQLQAGDIDIDPLALEAAERINAITARDSSGPPR